jgi:hypothetical protein
MRNIRLKGGINREKDLVLNCDLREEEHSYDFLRLTFNHSSRQTQTASPTGWQFDNNFKTLSLTSLLTFG